MAIESFAEPRDIAAVWQPLDPAEEILAPALLRQASTKLRLEARRRNVDIDSLVFGDELIAEAAKDTVVNAAKRVLMNPEAARQMSVTTGPMTESKTMDTALSSGLLYLSDSDLADVFPPVPRRLMRSFTVRAGMG